MGRRLAFIGLLLTAAYLALLTFMFWGRVVQILLMEPNEIGDFLAGAFGPLAILWLILGFFQQGIELRQNTDALKLQANELKNSVEQQKATADAMKLQVDTTREALEFERSRHASTSIPRFESHLQSVASESGVTTVYAKVRNLGGVATRVKMVQPSRHFHIDFTDVKSLVAWDAGEERGLRIDMMDSVYQSEDSFDFTLHFEDIEGSLLAQKFSLLRDAETKLPRFISLPTFPRAI